MKDKFTSYGKDMAIIMNILICDDMHSETQKISRLMKDSGFDVTITILHNGEDVLRHIHSGAVVDACFLDIVMPKMSGVTLAEKLRAEGFVGEIVFLTRTNEYAAESYAVEAFSYLIKPPTPESIRNILRKLENARTNNDTGGILVRGVGLVRYLLFRDISHIEVIQHKVYFRLIDGDVVEANATFSEIAPQLLQDRRFIQCYRSFVINMNAVSAIEGRDIIMQCGARIPISKSYPDVKKQYLQWLFGGENQ